MLSFIKIIILNNVVKVLVAGRDLLKSYKQKKHLNE